MLINIGMAFAVTVGLWFAWMLARFTLELRAALMSAASGSWQSNGDNAISSMESAVYCRDEIVLRHGEAPRVMPLTYQPQPDAPLVELHVS